MTRTRITKAISAAAGAAMALAAGASVAADNGRAQDRGVGTSDRFDRLDRNHDGYLSRDEAQDARELDTRFSELDKNNDGKLSRQEYEALDEGSRSATGASARPPAKRSSEGTPQ